MFFQSSRQVYKNDWNFNLFNVAGTWKLLPPNKEVEFNIIGHSQPEADPDQN